ncbi:FKBP-type peptidyl-prolyl cis-trans isomerase N-terminal domain-containing protein [Vibrio agarivorans]|uniref:FKBP-type peptidyl-prolyl cis-trans isomerase N-terminal domain-containing protein n=1 Tax=Vibrio agarivorans TaxID=153622 RepID=UPI00222FADBF|nr:FKBP-type peptidyl-prolyl cis-trans isomerase N-terminal domain-containing protein [Vibrio agarivorans]MDN3659749.1 FKBP-type peptidyl-prolyl cis-trans isomerase N-terminal domain-containing protein [Vibrio agarivorans]
MRSNIKITAFISTAILITGCQPTDESAAQLTQPSVQSEPSVTVTNQHERSEFIIETREQQQAYALGTTFANRLIEGLEHPTSVGIEVDKNYVLEGINDAFAGSSLVSPAGSSELLERLQEDIARATEKQNQS